MKKYIITLLTMLSLALSANAQTYIQGLDVIPLSGIANSPLLTTSGRIDMETAFTKLKFLDTKEIQKNVGDMAGEFWWIDGMLVQLVSRHITPSYQAEDYSKLRYAMRPEVISMIGGPEPDRTLQNDYFDELKSVNNFEVLINYFKSISYQKNFLIQDNQKRYRIFGTVYTSDHQKAHIFINTILNSIRFK